MTDTLYAVSGIMGGAGAGAAAAPLGADMLIAAFLQTSLCCEPDRCCCLLRECMFVLQDVILSKELIMYMEHKAPVHE